MYAVINNADVLAAALKLARGVYQCNILHGREALSGATLQGKAKRFGDRYAKSARSIMTRCQQAGLAVREDVAAHGKRIVVIG